MPNAISDRDRGLLEQFVMLVMDCATGKRPHSHWITAGENFINAIKQADTRTEREMEITDGIKSVVNDFFKSSEFKTKLRNHLDTDPDDVLN